MSCVFLIILLLILFKQGRPLVHDPKGGVMVQNGNLALRTVTRLAAGTYSCSASNVEGDAKSDIVNLQIMCKYCIKTFASFQQK